MVARRDPRSAFTLIELLVAMAVVTVLLTLLLPALGRTKEAAKNVKCMSNLHQAGLQTQDYVGQHEQLFPEFFYTFPAGNSGNIVVAIMPRFARVAGWDVYHPGLLVCPADDELATVPVRQDDNSIKDRPVSYGYNIGLPLAKVRRDQMWEPATTVVFYDGAMSHTRNGGKFQGAFKSPTEYMSQTLVRRHGEYANVVYADWHVDAVQALADEEDGGNGNSDNGNGNGRGKDK